MEEIATPSPYVLRTTRLEDLDLICCHREAMFHASGRSEAVLQVM